MKEFIQRLYIKDNDSSFYIFDEIINKSQISIILGEPASGKTYQLKYFDENSDSTKFVELMFIEDEEDILDTTKYILIDSIDEALSKNDSDKTTKNNLIKYIKKSLEINPIVKFVITCRNLEWKEIFEKSLKEIDKDIQIYHIQELSKEDINGLLVEKNIEEKDFWDFINQNFLDELLKNVLMIINIIDNFETYKSKSLKYFEIYEEIIKNHLLAKTNNERCNQLLKMSPIEMKLISSTLAIYFTLNHSRVIDASDLNMLASELYKINNIDITGEKLSIVLDSALFSGNRNKIRFFHKSIQEYLSAYFVIEKKLDIKTIKDLFSHSLGFYEEFEEVIIYLTNIEKRFFKNFVAFDPFIFRRHPYLDMEEQKLLLKNMLNILSNEQQTAWGKWEYIENSSLVNFDKSINIEVSNLVKQNIDTKNMNQALFGYVLSVLEHNYNKELQDFIFKILENIKLEKDVCFRYITRHRINNIEYNKELLRFILINDMWYSDEDYIYIHIFQTLYKHVEFKNLIILLQYFSLYTDKKVIENIDIQDLIFWFNNVSKSYKDKYEKIYSREQISFLIFLILKSFEEHKDKEILEKIFHFFTDQYIYNFDFYIGDYEKDKYILEFTNIKDYFWKYFFSTKDIFKSSRLLIILSFFKKPIKGLKDIIIIYPISAYLEHYLYLKGYSNFIDSFEMLVLEDTDFKSYLVENQKKWQEQKWYIEQEKSNRNFQNQKNKNDEKYKKLINNFSTVTDLYNIYNYAFHKKRNKDKLNEILKNDLGEVKYKVFMDYIKDSFNSDNLYLEIKKDLLKEIRYKRTYLFHFYFNNISKEYINNLIQTKEDYKKLYYYVYSYRKFESKYFLYITKSFISIFIDLSIESLKISTSRLSEIIYCFKKLNIYDLDNLKLLIEYIKSIYSKTLINIERNEKESFLNILSLEKENYDFIKSLYFIDSINEYTYFKSLLYIDINRAFDDYLNIVYPEGNKYLKFDIVGKINYVQNPVELNNYDNITISPICREKFKTLLAMLYSLKENRNFENIYQLNCKNFKFIFINYYDFFKEYHYPKSTFSPDIYTNMYELINAILNYIGSSDKFIPLLEDLQNTENKNMKAIIAYIGATGQ